MAIVRTGTFKKKSIQSFFIISDLHYKDLNVPTFEILKKFSKTVKNPKLIIAGDFLDLEFLMNNDNYKRNIKNISGIDDYFLPLFNEEIDWGNKTLDELSSMFDEIYFIEGNHDWRAQNFMETDCPDQYKYNFDLSIRLKLAERKIKHIKYNDWLCLNGDSLYITHGIYHGSNAHQKHYLACGGNNCIFGHIHHDDVKSFISIKTKKSWSLPSMAHLNPSYMKNRENNWTNGFGIISFYQGKFWVNIYNVFDNRLIVNGKIYER